MQVFPKGITVRTREIEDKEKRSFFRVSFFFAMVLSIDLLAAVFMLFGILYYVYY
jgi:hypothetical protein